MTSITQSACRLVGAVREVMSWLETVETSLVLSDVVIPTFDSPLSKAVEGDSKSSRQVSCCLLMER